jgi:hypothetical protein
MHVRSTGTISGIYGCDVRTDEGREARTIVSGNHRLPRLADDAEEWFSRTYHEASSLRWEREEAGA